MSQISSFLKIVSLNTEQDRHFERIIPFLKEHRPDVVLLQEVLERDITFLEETLEMKGIFSTLCYLKRPEGTHPVGLATFSAIPMTNHILYYRKNELDIPVVSEGEGDKMACSIIVTQVRKNNVPFCLVNVYFTWSPDGKPTRIQYQSLKALLKVLEPYPEFIMCGDFNAPRGTPIFNRLAGRYKDNIPAHVTTTIDKNLHRAGDLNLVIDGIFTTPLYQVMSIRLHDGVSDHWGMVAEVGLKQ